MAQVTGSNNLNKGNDIRLSFASTAQASVYNDIHIVAGIGKGSAARKALPALVTLSGDYDNVTEWQSFSDNVAMLMSELRMETSDTVNWENTTLIIGECQPNGQNPVEKRFYMNMYQESTGNGLKKSILIPKEALGNGEGLIITPQTYIRFERLRGGTTITAYLKIGAYLRSYTLDEGQF